MSLDIVRSIFTLYFMILRVLHNVRAFLQISLWIDVGFQPIHIGSIDLWCYFTGRSCFSNRLGNVVQLIVKIKNIKIKMPTIFQGIKHFDVELSISLTIKYIIISYRFCCFKVKCFEIVKLEHLLLSSKREGERDRMNMTHIIWEAWYWYEWMLQ